jgi:aspartyl-tRNA(Asn)/glutamyl-tRNA(Gln) amidotransferase subunit A
VPFTVKDNLWVGGRRITQGSKIFADFIAPRDAWTVERLRALGGVMIGITNCSEFACKGITTNPLHGTTRNPWDTNLTPGGSSGGAAAATAARFAPLALCTDAGGSVRRPAAHTGLVGFKPSTGVIPQPWGFPEPNLGISVTGVLARDVADAAFAFEHLIGYHPGDPFSVPATLASDTKPSRLAWSPRLGCGFAIDDDVLQAFEQTIARLRDAGHAIANADPNWPEGTREYPLLAVQQSGLAALFAQTLDQRRADFDPDIAAQIDAGRTHSGAEISRLMLQRETIAASLAHFFETHDLLLTPTAPVTAWPIGQPGPATIGGAPAGPRGHAGFTPLFNYCGVPAVSVPVALVRGLPIGLQIVGPRFADRRVLAFARELERVLRFDLNPPNP